MDEANKKKQEEYQKEIEQIRIENKKILEQMKADSDKRQKDIKLKNQQEIEKINEESKNRILANEIRINQILLQYQQDVHNYFQHTHIKILTNL